jgi:hypothetical protein
VSFTKVFDPRKGKERVRTHRALDPSRPGCPLDPQVPSLSAGCWLAPLVTQRPHDWTRVSAGREGDGRLRRR